MITTMTLKIYDRMSIGTRIMRLKKTTYDTIMILGHPLSLAVPSRDSDCIQVVRVQDLHHLWPWRMESWETTEKAMSTGRKGRNDT